MKKLNRSLTGGITLLLVFFLHFNLTAQDADTLLQPVCDAEIRQQQPLINYNLLSAMTLNPKSTSGQSTRGILKFQLNFDSLPENIQVTSAKIRLYTIGASHPATSKQIAAHRVINDWSEFDASWDKRTSNNWNSSGGDFASAPSGLTNAQPAFNWIEIDVTADLQAFRLDNTLNKGWVLKIHSEDNSGHQWTYATKEYLAGIFAPQLIINYGFFLPVDYKDFTAIQEADNVRLEWQTIKEVDNDRFDIEKSIDGRNWEMIGSVDGNGYSYSTFKYSFTDNKPADEVNYYRLKQYDFNGEYSYSQIVSVKFEKTNLNIISATGNIHQLNLNISAEDYQQANIKIIDLAGRIVLMEELHIEKGINTYSFGLNDFLSGIYIVVVDNGSELFNFKTYLK